MRDQAIQLRPASRNDDRLLFGWRNDLTTRSMFFSSKLVSWENHTDWLGKVLSDPDERLIVGELEGQPVGVIRLSRVTDSIVISVTVDPQSRGRGVATRLLGECIRSTEEWLQGIPFVARIKVGNAASVKMVQNCGFVEVESQGDAIVMHLAR